MKLQRRGLAPFLAGVALIAAGLLGLRMLGASSTPALATVQPSTADLRSFALKSQRVFRPYRTLGVYTYRAPNFKSEGGGVSGTLSQVLVILGTAKGGVLAVEELAGPLSANLTGSNEQGWQTALPPSPTPVRPISLKGLSPTQAFEVSAWLKATGLRQPHVALWSFPGDLLAVATEDGQSTARAFPASGLSTYIMGPQHLEGSESTKVFLKPSH